MALTELMPECESCDGDIVIEMLDEYGVAKNASLEVYYFYKASFGKDDGWYNDEEELIGEDIDDVIFPVGQGLWVTGMGDTTWQQAGQVYDADKSIPLADGKQMLSNPYATGLPLSKNIWIGCDSCDGDIVIEMLDEYGVAKNESLEVYYFYQNSFGKDDGWYNDEEELIGEDIDDVIFPAGQGLWVTGMADTTFDITSPLK